MPRGSRAFSSMLPVPVPLDCAADAASALPRSDRVVQRSSFASYGARPSMRATGALWSSCRFRRGRGKGIVSITAGNAMLRPCADWYDVNKPLMIEDVSLPIPPARSLDLQPPSPALANLIYASWRSCTQIRCLPGLVMSPQAWRSLAIHPRIAGSRGIAQIATGQHDDDELASPSTPAPADSAPTARSAGLSHLHSPRALSSIQRDSSYHIM
jgi:hypothetical protein